MRQYPGAFGFAAKAVRSPRATARSVRSKSLAFGLDTSDRLPLTVRRGIYRPLGAITASALRRRGDHSIAAPIRMIALHEIGNDQEAFDVATNLHADASRRTIIRLARVSMLLARVDVADGLLARLPVEEDGAGDPLAGFRGKIDFRMGRYQAAVENLEVAAARDPVRTVWTRRADRARGHLTLLDPAWRPDIPAVRAIPREQRQLGRIVHLLGTSLPYKQAGYTVRAQQVAQCQQAVGLDPHMVTRAGFPGSEGVLDAPPRDEVDGVVYERVEPNLEIGLPIDQVATETARGLAGLIAALCPAVIQPTTDYVNAQVALALGERFDLPVVYEVRGFLEETWRSRLGESSVEYDRYVLGKTVETECMRRATGIVTLSETMRTDILERGGIDPDRVVVIPNAVDVDRFVPGPRDEALAAELGITPEETVVGYISSFSAYEGITYLIEAVGQLHRLGRKVRLLLVGDGDERANLEATAASEGLLEEGTVIFTGRVPHAEIERYYRAIDIFVVPRTNDRVSQLVTPLKPYEAMAMAKAVVVSGVGALLEIVRDGETGRSFTPEDPTSLAEALDALIDDPAERRRLGLAAREWVSENRTWAQNGLRYLEFYQRLGVA